MSHADLFKGGVAVLVGLLMGNLSSLCRGQDAGMTASMVVGQEAQLHSPQVFGSELVQVLQTVDAHCQRLAGRLVKLHLVCSSEAIAQQARQVIAARYALQPPASTYVVGRLADATAVIGVDAVIALAETSNARTPVREESWGRILPVGSRVYISGQAEKAATPSEATTATLASLARTLQWLGSSLDDVVQVKAFLNPISAAAEVRETFKRFCGDRQIPLVLVEWESTLPIEIELIAAAPPGGTAAPAVEYLTPPGFTASPVYCRVAKVNAASTLYIGSLWSAQPLAAPQEVTDVFQQLEGHLTRLGSDLKHLVKATYYVSAEETSKQLNVLRPQYYDPKSPPAASKAVVAGVGQANRFLTLDMIAVPVAVP